MNTIIVYHLMKKEYLRELAYKQKHMPISL